MSVASSPFTICVDQHDYNKFRFVILRHRSRNREFSSIEALTKGIKAVVKEAK